MIEPRNLFEYLESINESQIMSHFDLPRENLVIHRYITFKSRENIDVGVKTGK